MFLSIFQHLLRILVNVSQWRMEIGNFHNSISNSFCNCVFYMSKSWMVIAYLLYAALLKDIVNSTLVFAFFFFVVFRTKVNVIIIQFEHILYWNILSSFISNIWYCKCLLQLTGDIDLNPGLKPNYWKKLLGCHWNLNSITSHNFIKVSLLMAYNSIHKFDVICLSETYLNSETLSNIKKLNVPGYNLIKADHLTNTNAGKFASTSKNHYH